MKCIYIHLPQTTSLCSLFDKNYIHIYLYTHMMTPGDLLVLFVIVVVVPVVIVVVPVVLVVVVVVVVVVVACLLPPHGTFK